MKDLFVSGNADGEQDTNGAKIIAEDNTFIDEMPDSEYVEFYKNRMAPYDEMLPELPDDYGEPCVGGIIPADFNRALKDGINYLDYVVFIEEPKSKNPYEHVHDLEHILAQGDLGQAAGADAEILKATKAVIKSYSEDGVLNIKKLWDNGVEISSAWIVTVTTGYELLNQLLPKGQKIAYLKRITERAVAWILMATGEFTISTDVRGKKSSILMRQRAGYDIGTWVAQRGNDDLDRLINIMNADAKEPYRKEVRNVLMTEIEPYEKFTNNTIIRLHDGIYDCITKEFTRYEEERYEKKYGHLVSDSKLYGIEWTDKTSDELERECTFSHKDGTVWSPIQGLIDLVGNDVALRALREILHFAIRRMSGGFVWWFLNTSGNSAGGGGKSTFIQIVKNLVGGERNALTKSYDHLGDRFALTGLESKYVIVSDETEGANKKPDDTSVYKALASNGTISIDVKYENEYSLKWSGVMIQAINGLPLFSDNSDSTYRRFLALPWEKKLTNNGKKRDYIRDDYINRPKVLQCYMKWALELGCLETYSDEVIEYCLKYVEMMKSGVKTVYEFMPEMMRRAQDEGYFDGMNEIGRNFLYKLYCKWDEVDNCVRNHISQKKFWTSVCEWVQAHPKCGWYTTEKVTHIYKNTPFQQELVDYDLGPEWCNYSSHGFRRPDGFFSFQDKTIRCGLIRANKLPRNTNPNKTSGNPSGTSDTDGPEQPDSK